MDNIYYYKIDSNESYKIQIGTNIFEAELIVKNNYYSFFTWFFKYVFYYTFLYIYYTFTIHLLVFI